MKNDAVFAAEANNGAESIVNDAAVEQAIDTARTVEKSYFHFGAESALAEFVCGFGYDDLKTPSDEMVRRFIDSFRIAPEIDLGIEYRTPFVLFDEFSSDLDYVFNHTDDIAAAMFVNKPPVGMELLTRSEVSERIWRLDRELMARHLPSYRLPWRAEGQVYWHSHAHHLASFVIANPLLELALRSSHEEPIISFRKPH